MQKNSKATATKKVASKSVAKKKVSAVKQPKLTFWQKRRATLRTYLENRTHRSFRRTRRRDYIRPLPLPGVFAFTHGVNRTIFRNIRPLMLLAVLYAALYSILVGVTSQDVYSSIVDGIQSDANSLGIVMGSIQHAGLTLLSIIGLTGNGETTDVQRVFAGLLFLLLWLTVVWFLRNTQAGQSIRLRDALYNSGAPLLSTLCILMIAVAQLAPVGLGLLAYSAAQSSGLLAGGVEAMLFWAAISLLVTLSLYWLTSTLFAFVVITLPGMYPVAALKISRELILGRRVRILFRWLWMSCVVIIAWGLVLIPMILFDMWIKSLISKVEWVPIVPFAIVVMGTLTTIWVATYVYLLYRKVVDHGTES